MESPGGRQRRALRLHQDKLVTWLGVWMREHLSAAVAVRTLTWSVLTTEWLGFTLIITPCSSKKRG